ncbi:GNAT family N-acetyltransferase [Streptomyces sparsus]
MNAPAVPPTTTVEPVTDADRPAVERLAQLYRHDLSEFLGSLPRSDGTFPFPQLSLSFAEPGRQALAIRYCGSLAGFALTRLMHGGEAPADARRRSVSAFFVVRALRRRGVGRQAALRLLHSPPGPWGIAHQPANLGAARFWRQVAADAVGTAWREEHRPPPGKAPGESAPDVWIMLDTTPRAGPAG